MRTKALAAVISLSLAVSAWAPAADVFAEEPYFAAEGTGPEETADGTEEPVPADSSISGEDTAEETGRAEASETAQSGAETPAEETAGTEASAEKEDKEKDGKEEAGQPEDEIAPEKTEEAEPVAEESETTEKEQKTGDEPETTGDSSDTSQIILDPEESEPGEKINPQRKQIDGKYYVVYEDGSHHTGWFTFKSGNKCYCDPENDGALLTGIARIDSKGYLFTSAGILKKNKEGVIKNSGKWYYVKKSGRLFNGWKNTDKGRMYFRKSDFAAQTGVKKISGNGYLFSDKGILADPGTPLYKGNKYFVQADGTLASGWVNLGDWKLYFSPTSYRGFIGIKKIGSRYYYFNSTGVLLGEGGGTPVIDGKKYWTRSDGSLRTGWLNFNGMRCYFLPKKFYCAIGAVVIDGKKYIFDEDGILIETGRQLKDGRMYYYNEEGELYRNTWVTYNGEKIYVDGNGIGLADLSDKIPGPYTLYVDRSNCVVTAYSGSTPVRSMLCSVGTPGNETPGGTMNIFAQYILKELMGPSWGQYASKVHSDGIYFHSVATESPSDPWHSVPVGEYNKLGQPASHGCIRLCVRDAKWIYEHCPIGTTVVIGDWFDMPFGKPFLTKISTPVDPTDPAV